MADKDKQNTTSKKTKSKQPKKKDSMRESAAKSRKQAAKPKRVRKAASAATKPVGKVGGALTADYHVIEPKDGGNFFTKSRKLTPSYLRNSWKEVRQVTWPKRKETWRLVIAVFIFAIAMGTMIAVLDYGLEKVLRKVIL